MGEYERTDQLGGDLLHVGTGRQPAFVDAERHHRVEGLVLMAADSVLEVGDLGLVGFQ